MPMHCRTAWRLLSSLIFAGCLVSALAEELAGDTAAGGDAPPLTVAEPTVTNRVTAGALLWPKRAHPNEVVTLYIKVRLAPGFHIYALDHSGVSTMPTKIIDSLPNALRPQCPWRSTAPKTLEDGSRVLMGDVLFQRPLRVSAAARPGTNVVPVELQFQICNEALCWPPDKLQLKTQLEVLSSMP